MKSTRLLRQNIKTLLRSRGHSQHDLAFFCHRSDAWIAKILNEHETDEQARNLPLKYLDKIADFFGLETYQLFQPGISPLTERRKGSDRRAGRDRRSRAVQPGTMRASELVLTAEDVSDVLLLKSLDRKRRGDMRKTLDEQVRGTRKRRPRPSPHTAAAAQESAAGTPIANDLKR